MDHLICLHQHRRRDGSPGVLAVAHTLLRFANCLGPVVMSLCALCGFAIRGGDTLCPCHTLEGGDRWAENNRCMCDLLHRGRVPPRLPPAQRGNELRELAELIWAEVA